MKKILLALFLAFTLMPLAFAGSIFVEEEDGSPSVPLWKLKVGNGSLTDNGDATATLNTGSGSGDSVTVDGTSVDTTAAFASSGDVDFVFADGGAGGPDTVTGNINADVVGADELADTDFGDFSCSDGGGGCTLDGNVVDSAEINTNAVGEDELDGSMNETISGSWNFSGGILEVPNNTATTSTDCDVAGEAGRIFVDTDATSGQQLYVCEGTSGWVLQGDGGGGGGAPTDATYIVQTADGTLSAEQALSSLSSGIMRVATTTGVITSLTDSSGIASNISDETGSGALAFATSPTFTTPLISGKIDADAGAVNDDDCTGEQGLFWYDDTDSAFEFCNANSGTPTVLGGGGASVEDDAYGAGWNGDTTNAPSQNAVYDEMETRADTAGDSYTGAHDFGGADSIEVPNSATPTVNAAGELALDTTITSYDGLLKYYDGTTEMTVVAMPTADLTTTDNHTVAYASAKNGFNMEAQAGGGGGTAFNEVPLPIQSAKITGAFVTDGDATQGAQIDAGEGNWRLLFDATTDEGAVWGFKMPNNYSSAPILEIIYSMASATANEVEFEGAIMCVSDGDSADVGTASFSTIAVGSATVPGTAGYPDKINITLTDDSCAADDYVYVYLSTDSDDATNDDATGDREVTDVTLSYTAS